MSQISHELSMNSYRCLILDGVHMFKQTAFNIQNLEALRCPSPPNLSMTPRYEIHSECTVQLLRPLIIHGNKLSHFL